MFTRKTLTLLLISTSFFSLPGCSPSQTPEHKGGFYYSGIYFGKHFSYPFKLGIEDGCTTAKGDYTKTHTLFNYSKDYEDGWFLGRNRCKHLLVLDDDAKKEE